MPRAARVVWHFPDTVRLSGVALLEASTERGTLAVALAEAFAAVLVLVLDLVLVLALVIVLVLVRVLLLFRALVVVVDACCLMRSIPSGTSKHLLMMS